MVVKREETVDRLIRLMGNGNVKVIIRICGCENFSNISYCLRAVSISSDPFDSLFPEPGTRAPDTEKRKTASVTATVNLFRPYLEEWCEKCVVCPVVNPIEKKDGNRNWPREDDYDEFF